MAARTVDNVVVHPLVLLSAVDHYNRVAKDSRNRVVGVLLGETYKGRVDVTNSFAVPFEEDHKSPGIFFLNHDYVEQMYAMFRKISAKERIIGFYSTGPKIRPADIELDKMFRGYTSTPVMVIIDVRPGIEGLPTQAYVSVEQVVEGKETVRTFAHVSCEVGAYEAEEVGVEHLLRDVNDPSVSNLAADVKAKLSGLRGLASKLQEITVYLEAVLTGKLPANTDILNHVQLVLAQLPNIRLEPVVKALHEATNDQHLVLYVASLTRSVLALHDLVQNKIKFKDEDESDGKKKKEEDGKKEDGKEGDAKKEGEGKAKDGKEGKEGKGGK